VATCPPACMEEESTRSFPPRAGKSRTIRTVSVAFNPSPTTSTEFLRKPILLQAGKGRCSATASDRQNLGPIDRP
jgi:hypothetical protein